MEVALERLRGRLLVFVGSAFLLLLGLALLVGFGLYLAGQVVSPVLIAIILVATALGIVVPLLEDVDESASDFGQLHHRRDVCRVRLNHLALAILRI